MQHEQAIDHLEEYVLGTLSPELASEVEQHLDSGCEVCRLRLVELGETAAHMAGMITPIKPPPELKEKIMASITTESHSSGNSASGSTGGRVTRILALFATAAALLLAAWGWKVTRENKSLQIQLDQRESRISRMEKEIEAYMDATSLLTSPGMQFFDLAGVAPNDQAFGKVVIKPDGGNAVVYMYELPPTPEGMAYQLWMVRDGVPTSVGTFTVNEDGSAKLMLDPLPDGGAYAKFDVTIEPAGGAPKPTGMMYLTSPQVIQLQDSE